MRFLATDTPIIQQALSVYIKAIQEEVAKSAIEKESETAHQLLDGLEHAHRLLARANQEMAKLKEKGK